MTAAIYCARKKNDPVVLADEVGGQTVATSEIHNYPGIMSISGIKLIDDMKKQAEFLGVEIKEKKKIISIKKTEGNIFEVSSEDGSVFWSKSVIIASGKKPRNLKAKGNDQFNNKGLTYCSICDAPLFTGKDVVVVGGGNAGFEATIDLLKYANKIYILEFTDVFRGDAVSRDLLEKSGKVEFIANAEVLEVFGDNFVGGVKYKNRQDMSEHTLKVEGVFVQIGSVANIDFVKDLVKINRGAIETNKKCETSVEGIFAAGDVTDSPYWQIVIACGEGAKAALVADEYINKMNDNK